MGFAILWVMFLHSNLSIDSELVYDFKRIGYGGVDIFMFASGLGCSYSLNKNRDILAFLKRRAVRVLPTWWIFLIGWWACHKPLGLDWAWESFVGNFFLIQALVDWHYCFNWYLSAMLVTYLMAPYCFELTERDSFTWRGLLIVELILLLMCMPCLYNDYLILVTRFPLFFMGFYFARLARQGVVIGRREAIGLAFATVIGFVILYGCIYSYPEKMMNDLGLWWYPFVLLTPGLCFGISFALSRMPTLNKILSTVGELSFEIYLMHLALLFYVIIQPPFDNAHWLGWFAVSIVGGAALKFIVSKIMRREARR